MRTDVFRDSAPSVTAFVTPAAWRRPLRTAVLAAITVVAVAFTAQGQITRHPTGVNVNAMGATTVFLTFGNLNGRVPVEAMWCGELIPASPHFGNRCDPSTIFGQLPLRYDLSRPSGVGGFTDIMSIPPSVARRAYQAAAAGRSSEFFYVRRFVDPAGGPDEYVTVTCRMTDGGARTPFAVTSVRLGFATEDPVAGIRPGEEVPAFAAHVEHTGTGRLRGRWEIVRPGEEAPNPGDLLPEASLPLELRVRQRRYAMIGRFDVFLPPGGRAVIPGPDPSAVPADAPGEYLVLFRLEATDDKEGDSDLAATGAGTGLAHAGGVAGFAVPPLRYQVGSTGGVGVAAPDFRAIAPHDSNADTSRVLVFRWSRHAGAILYRIELADANDSTLFSAVVPGSQLHYRAPIWLRERVGAATVRWRAMALGTGARTVGVTAWRALPLVP